jgi:osmotically-inducible protein OsmY
LDTPTHWRLAPLHRPQHFVHNHLKGFIMKKFTTYLASLMMVFTMMAGIVACSATSQHESTGQMVDDSAITAKVKAELVDDMSLKTATDINVETAHGVVQLSGFVKSQNEINTAVRIAQGVNGVRSVKNNMSIRP